MSVRKWAIKIGELKPLSRAGLLLLSVRTAMRVEPWLPSGADPLWREGIDDLTKAAFKKPERSRRAMALARKLSDLGATACNRLIATDEPLGRCMNYAVLTLSTAIDATNLDTGPELKQAVIDSAKMSGSIAAILAHANRVVVPPGDDPVEVACLTMWNAIRADIPTVASVISEVEVAKDRVDSLRKCSPFWIDGQPTWVPYSRHCRE
jgi:hypothetical protein